jgi:hypothetical protein
VKGLSCRRGGLLNALRRIPSRRLAFFGLRRGRDSNAIPPRTPSRLRRAPPAFLPIGTRVAPCAVALGSRPLRGCGWLGGTSVFSIGKAPSFVVPEPIQLRFEATRRARLSNTLKSSYHFRHSNKQPREKPNSLGHRFNDEQALYMLLASSGMRISEALAIERRNFTNDGCTVQVRSKFIVRNPSSSPI